MLNTIQSNDQVSVASKETPTVGDEYFGGSFTRSGHDLILHDGAKQLVISEYFSTDTPPALTAPNGAMLTGETVKLLAGPAFPGQYAQAGATLAPNAIGTVQKLEGSASAQRADGSTVELKLNDSVFKGDVLNTSDGSTLGLMFSDGTAFVLQGGTRMVLNEFIFNPASTSNSALFSFVQGTFSMVAGKLAPTGDFKVATPIATMGIRGTSVLGVQVNVPGGRLSLTTDPGGGVGAISVIDNVTGVLYTVLETIFSKIVLTPNGLVLLLPKSIDEVTADQGFTQLLHDVFGTLQVPQAGPDQIVPQHGPNRFPAPPVIKIDFNAGTLPTLKDLLLQTGLDLSTLTTTGPNNQLLNSEVTPTNSEATITGDVTGTVTEDGDSDGTPGTVQTVNGTLTVSDVDTGQNVFQAVAAADLIGAYGTFTFDEQTGAWTYTLDNAAAQALTANDQVFDTLTVTSADGTDTETITITIDGTNDGATITGDVTGTVTEDGDSDGTPGTVQTVNGTLTVSDVDTGQNVFQAVAAADLIGAYGTFTFDEQTGAWTYTLDNAAAQALTANDQVFDTLTVTSADGTDTETITITIDGTNDGATITGDVTGTVTEDGDSDGTPGTVQTVNGTLTVSDVDTGQNVFQAVAAADLIGAYGTFTFDEQTGAWTYTLDNAAAQALTANDQVFDTLTVTSADGTDTETITITIDGTNDGATITGDVTGTVTEDGDSDGTPGTVQTVNGTLTVSDVDTGQNVFQAVAAADLIGAYGTFTFDEQTGAWTYTLDNAAAQALTANDQVFDTLTVTSADGTDTETITITIDGTNDGATITGDVTGTVTEDGDSDGTPGTVQTVNGTLTVSDVDTGQNVFQAVAAADLIGAYGTFTFDEQTGAWTYTLDNAAAQALTANDQVFDTLTVTSADGTDTETITITIDGTNDGATITGDVTGTVTEDGDSDGTPGTVQTVNGTLTVSDVDTGQNVFQAVAAADLIGAYGTFTFDEQTGAWTYTLDNAAAQALTANDQVFDTLTVTSADGTDTETITITIDGTNDGATITGDVTGTVTEDGDSDGTPGTVQTVNGTLTVSDVDTGQNVFQAVAAADLIGAYGTFTFDEQTGAWTYTLDNAAAQALTANDQVFDTLTVTSADGTDTETITITIDGTNDGATITGDVTGTVTEDGDSDGTPGTVQTVNGTLTVSDVDTGQNVFQAVAAADLIGAYGTFTFDEQTGAWTYTLDNAAAQALTANDQVFDTLTVTSADGTDTETITITIDGTNDGATITGDVTGTVTEDGDSDGTPGTVQTVNGTLTVSDVDTGQNVFQAVAAADLIGAYGTFTFDEQTGAWTYTLDNAAAQALTANDQVFDTLTVTSADGTDTETITITIDGTNDEVNYKPTVSAPTSITYFSAANSSDHKTGFINRLSFQDGNGNVLITVTLAVSGVGSTLTALNTSDYDVTILSGDKSNTLVLQGTVEELNAYLTFGQNVIWNPKSSTADGKNLTDDTLTVTVSDGSLSDQITVNLIGMNSLPNEFFGTGQDPSSSNDFSTWNMYGITGQPDGANGNDTMITTWSHEPNEIDQEATVVSYIGGKGTDDTIRLVFTPDQIAEILTGITTQNDLRNYLDDSPGTLSLGGTSWNATATGFEFANVSLANGYGTGIIDVNTYLKPVPALFAGTTGDAFDNLLIDAIGGQTLSGGGGDDVLVAHNSGSTLNGDSGRDLLLGRDGSDTLDGGSGQDVLAGGSGGDTFKISSIDAADIILDYGFSEGDEIDLSSVLGPGIDETNVDSYVRLTSSGTDLTLQINQDGAGSDWTNVAVLTGYNTNDANPVSVTVDSTTVTMSDAIA